MRLHLSSLRLFLTALQPLAGSLPYAPCSKAPRSIQQSSSKGEHPQGGHVEPQAKMDCVTQASGPTSVFGSGVFNLEDTDKKAKLSGFPESKHFAG
jgi:hypothetical protein